MRCKTPIYLYLLLVLFSLTSFAHAQKTSQSFTIEKGSATLTPARCPPETCSATPAKLTGTFEASIDADTLLFTASSVITSPDIGFDLPETPNESSGGTSRGATFTFDGEQLIVSGVVDSRAFDGPLYEYKFMANIKDDEGFNPKGYYTARQDFRKCASPMCGGIFVKAVNKRVTKCADGKRREECYVGTVNWEKIGVNPFNLNADIYFSTPLLLKGKISSNKNEVIEDYGLFTATEAYRPATNNLPQGTFAALENKGIFCITSPCFSIDESILNRKKTKVISGFDLNPVGASGKDVDIAYNLFANDLPLIVAGYNRRQRELNGVGVSFIANQFYLPIKPDIQKCTEGYDLIDGICATPHGCEAPLLELSTIGGMPMVDPISGEITANITYSCVKSCEPPAFSSGFASCTLALP